MTRTSVIAIFLFIFPLCLIAQVGRDSIYIWDNDRGQSIQALPAVGSRSWGSYVAFQDSRWGIFDIYRQGTLYSGAPNGPNTMVSNDPYNQGLQTRVDIEGNPTTMFVAVWEESLLNTGAVMTIKGRRYTSPQFDVYSGTRSSRLPAVSCRDNGAFIVSFTNYDLGYPRIVSILYDSLNNPVFNGLVRQRDSVLSRPPRSRAAFCDSGYVIVYEDSSRNGTQRSVYMQYRKRDGSPVADRIKVSRPGGDAFNEECPDVAVNKTGFVVVVWEDYYYGAGNPNVLAQTYQMEPGANMIVTGPSYTIAQNDRPEIHPRVTVFPNNDFVVVWEQANTTNPALGQDVWARMGLSGGLLNAFVVNQEDTLDQRYPDISCRNMDSLSIAWMSDAYSGMDDIFVRHYRKMITAPTGLTAITPDIQVVSSDTVGGRKGWYFDNENYDNPATPGWNEDPIAEPESIYVDLDFAMVDQLMELNTNNQYIIFNEDTLPPRRDSRALSVFDAVFLDLGYRTPYATAGVITNTEQATIEDYLDPGTGTGGPVMVEGNDFGSMYSATTLFYLFHAQYQGDGADCIQGNIDTLYGTSNAFAAGETLKYNYHDWVDNYPDSFRIRDGRIILYGSGATDWSTGRTVGYNPSWKKDSRLQGRTILNGFPLCGITSSTHPHTYAEYYRRCLGFLGLQCQPEPITTLTAVPGSSEGRVTITWRVVNDDTLGESAEGPYKLKFARAKMTSEAAFDDSSETYYQTWNTKDSTVGKVITQNLGGLPPLDTLVFALKVSDEDTLWDALGAEPQAVVYGDSVTPHSITLGTNYVKDFSNAFEFLHRRRPNDSGTNYDSLWVTWNGTYFFVGFARCNFRTEGDLFVYVDTRTGGGDSTVGYNGTSGKSSFINTFRPDFVLIVEDSGNVVYKRWNPAKGDRGTWEDTTFGGSVMIDNMVNSLLLTELRMPYNGMGYTSPAPFKLVVLMQSESSNQILNAFPISNPLGSSQHIAAYYYWDGGLASGYVPNKSYAIIGIDEETQMPHDGGVDRLSACPNPFTGTIDIRIPMNAIGDSRRGSLKIYDVSGRLVRTFGLSGTVKWDGKDEESRQLPYGVYFCCLEYERKSEVLKVIYSR